MSILSTSTRHLLENARHPLPYPFTVERYHHAIEAGIVPEGAPYELIDGQIVLKDRSAIGEDPMTIGLLHAWAVKNLDKLDRKLERLNCHIRTQQPVTLSTDGEPEPDGSIVFGTNDDYQNRRPTNADTTCVIEVADHSLQFDRTTKQRLYAEANIPQYVIVNLVDRCLEVYIEPQPDRGLYGKRLVLHGKDKVELRAAKNKRLAVAVKTLLP